MCASDKQKFIDNIIFSSTLAATVQRASVYRKDAPEQCRQKFREGLEQELKDLLEQYNNPVSPAIHCENIEILAKNISAKHRAVLADGNFRIGLAQKALNLYLKFYWCLGHIPIPPHCPIDSIVLKEVPGNNVPWTKITQISEYKSIIDRAKLKAKELQLPLSEWEIHVYNKTQRQSQH